MCLKSNTWISEGNNKDQGLPFVPPGSAKDDLLEEHSELLSLTERHDILTDTIMSYHRSITIINH